MAYFISAAFLCEMSPISYHFTAAARRISYANSSGDRRRAEKASSGSSMVTIVGMATVPYGNDFDEVGRDHSHINRAILARDYTSSILTAQNMTSSSSYS